MLTIGQLAHWYPTAAASTNNTPALVVVLDLQDGGATCTMQTLTPWADIAAGVMVGPNEIRGPATADHVPYNHYPAPIPTAATPTAGAVSAI